MLKKCYLSWKYIYRWQIRHSPAMKRSPVSTAVQQRRPNNPIHQRIQALWCLSNFLMVHEGFLCRLSPEIYFLINWFSITKYGVSISFSQQAFPLRELPPDLRNQCIFDWTKQSNARSPDVENRFIYEQRVRSRPPRRSRYHKGKPRRLGKLAHRVYIYHVTLYTIFRGNL